MPEAISVLFSTQCVLFCLCTFGPQLVHNLIFELTDNECSIVLVILTTITTTATVDDTTIVGSSSLSSSEPPPPPSSTTENPSSDKSGDTIRSNSEEKNVFDAVDATVHPEGEAGNMS